MCPPLSLTWKGFPKEIGMREGKKMIREISEVWRQKG